jgi:hypothetical protein
MGVFSTLFLSLHRSSFQEFVVESVPSNAEKLFFSLTDFSKIGWIENGKEFEFNNKLYDVSKIERTTQGFYVYCVNDSVEESFIAVLDQWKKNNSPGSKAKTIFQPQFCNQLCFENVEWPEIVQIEFLFKSSPYDPPTSRTPSPPPRLHS